MNKKFGAKTTAFLRDCDGSTAIEYNLLTSMFGVVMIGVLSAFGDSAAGLFDYISNLFVGSTSSP